MLHSANTGAELSAWDLCWLGETDRKVDALIKEYTLGEFPKKLAKDMAPLQLFQAYLPESYMERAQER